ncbi:hypothetical protein HETIRDRAFT_323881 [Heterobasidion irregulare TC 32-1]|uniref:Palmitoyltransferase n=1 Tax=Heterobasidion irregulare (strain TC 32-1) TaxID=747525 RepID=W4JZV7_HETIT|nr:uncharacterized protein HETIRDRAFT_323881 [Heterobasidion irregulare TC 32-1]ETW79014.1 hypothetical protein HETIRDRAFT_323881 [Heterobasidion irregulare TC 32-1]
MRGTRRCTMLAVRCFFPRHTMLGMILDDFSVGWILQSQNKLFQGAVYILTLSFLFPTILALYLHLCLGRETHSVPSYLIPVAGHLTEPYECRADGTLDVCFKDNCEGRWKPPGTHHCSACGVCRLGFDHHCPWLGNCLTTRRLKPFLALLFLTPPTVVFAATPVIEHVWKYAALALATSRADAWAVQAWWARWWSWVVWGGPVGRWFVGVIIGFRLLEAEREREMHVRVRAGELPHARLAVLICAGTVLGLFSLGMVVATVRDILRGQTALDGIILRRVTRGIRDLRPDIRGRTHTNGMRYICIPDINSLLISRPAHTKDDLVHAHASTDVHLGADPIGSKGTIFPVLPDECLYDLGWRRNWNRAMAGAWFSDSIPDSGDTSRSGSEVYIWPKINPGVLRRIRTEVRAQKIARN